MTPDFTPSTSEAEVPARRKSAFIVRSGVLGLDLATKWGWAYIGPDGDYVDSGYNNLTKYPDLGARMHALQMSIADLVTSFAPDWIAIEKPTSTHYGAARALFAYAAAAAWVAHVREIGYVERSRAECYERVVGKGNAKKIAAVEFGRQFKPLLNSDDESDAILVALTVQRERLVEAV